jgi:hypothetical protein
MSVQGDRKTFTSPPPGADPADFPTPSAPNQAKLQTACTSTGCSCAIRAEEIAQKAVAAERIRAATVEIAQWNQCFGKDAPKSPMERRLNLYRIASTRAVLALMLARPTEQK